MKYAALSALFALIVIAPSLSGEEQRKLEPGEEISRAAPVAIALAPTYILVRNQQDTSSAIRIVNNTGLKLTAHWEAVPKTATEEDYNFPFPDPETLEPGQFIDIPVTVYAESLPGSLHQVLEIFARDVAYRNWSRNEVIEDVLFHYDLHGLGYSVNDEPFFGSFNFQAVGLTSDEYFTFRVELRDENGNFHSSGEQDITIYDLDRPPVLAIRGTEPDEAEDWFTNLDPDGIGFSQFFFNRDPVEEWLRNVSDPEQGAFFFRPHITGHSLGGALSQWFAASYTSSGGNLGEIVTFASPGIASRNSFDHGTSRFDANRADSVTHYITAGDIVSLAGQRYLPGSIRQLGLNPTWVESHYLAGPASVFNFGHDQYKHLVPVLAPFIDRDKLFQNPLPRMDLFYDGNNVLDDFFYSFVPPHDPDPDYFAFLQMVASFDAASRARVGPLFAAQLTFRGTAELNRQAIGSTLWNTPLLANRRIQKIWQAAQAWRRQAWESIQAMTKGIVGSGNKLAKLQAGTAAAAVNFWEASAQWPEEAWDVSPQWQNFAWKAMEGWSAAQWEATVRADFLWHETPNWTQDQWENVEAPPAKTIRGRVFVDANGNGQDDAERGRSGETIFVDSDQDGILDDNELKTTTQGNGEFNLITSTLSAGTYHIRQSLEDPNWAFTEPPDGKRVINLDDDPNQVVEGVQFGNQCIGDCDDEEPPDEDRIVISDDAFVQIYRDLGHKVRLDTGIRDSDYACGIIGWEATGGDIDEDVKNLGPFDPIVQAFAFVESGRWHISADFRTKQFPENWDVRLLCMSNEIASTGGPQQGKPVFFRHYPELGDNIRFNTGIDVDQYACGIVGFTTGSDVGDINEGGTGDIVQAYAYPEGGTWRLRADFRTHLGSPIIPHENWSLDLMCVDTDAASPDGPVPEKAFFFDRFTSLGDNIRHDTGIPIADYVCGVVGHAALDGDIDEHRKSSGTNLYQAYMFAENETWHIRADFRTHRNNEDWDINVFCAARGGVPPDIPINVSREERGIENCMGESMKCQVLQNELLTLRGELIVTGGGFSGSPTQIGYRCDTDSVEIYINDRDPGTGKPRWSWPDICLKDGDKVTLLENTVYDLRSTSIVGGTTIPFQLSEAPPPPPNRPPTISAPAFHALYWKGAVEFDITATDPDGHHVTILANGLPDGATITPTTGTGSVVGKFFWNPDANDVGDYEFTVTARDGKGATSAPKVIFIKVCDSPKCLELF